jgi:uncharacterized Zn finger protein
MSDYYNWYRPKPPRHVKGGIKTASKRGPFAGKWWGKRWLATLESFHIGARLARGRSYARKGQVTHLDIRAGRVTAGVQGTCARPYRITIAIKLLSTQQWQRIVDELVEQPVYAAQLLGNEMPVDIETIFQKAGVNLFPNRSDLEGDCSCPDWSNPCKHIAAVYYLMAEAFDRNPFMLFTLRGMQRDTFLELLRKRGEEAGITQDEVADMEPDPLPEQPDRFWDQGLVRLPEQRVHVDTRIHAALPKRLGPVSFWRSETDFLGMMDAVYQRAQEQAFVLLDNLNRNEKSNENTGK